LILSVRSVGNAFGSSYLMMKLRFIITKLEEGLSSGGRAEVQR
jgi:hypothetical protein